MNTYCIAKNIVYLYNIKNYGILYKYVHFTGSTNVYIIPVSF